MIMRHAAFLQLYEDDNRVRNNGLEVPTPSADVLRQQGGDRHRCSQATDRPPARQLLRGRHDSGGGRVHPECPGAMCSGVGDAGGDTNAAEYLFTVPVPTPTCLTSSTHDAPDAGGASRGVA